MSNLTANSPRAAIRSTCRTIVALFMTALLVGCGTESPTTTVGSDASEREHAEQPEQFVFTTLIHDYSNTASIDQ